MVWANDAYLEATGRERGAVIGRLMFEEFPSDPQSESGRMLRGSFKRVFEHGVTDHLPLIPYAITGPDGQTRERYWSATHTPIRNGEGETEFILQHTQEITELHDEKMQVASAAHAEMVRRAREVTQQNLELDSATSFFKLIFDQAPSFMTILTGPEHVFQIANDAYLQLVGGQRELIGKTVREALPEIEGQGFFELLDQVYETGESVTLTGAEVLIRRNDDAPPERAFVDFVYQPLDDAEGTTIGIFVQGHDVTAQKIAESSLREAEKRFRTMAHTMPVQVWTARADGSLDWLSEQVYSYTGAETGSLEGDAWASVVYPDDVEHVLEVWSQALADGCAYETEFRIRRADGVYRWHLVRASPIRHEDGTLLRWVGTNADIHDQKAMSQQLSDLNATLEARVEKRNRELEEVHARLAQSQRVEAVGNLAGGIAHDFNNLLQAMTGSLTMAAREIPPESPASARLDAAMRAVERGAALSSQLLAFSRRQPLQPRPLDLRELLGDIDDMLRSALGEEVAFEISAPEDLWPAFVDAASMQNAVLNLAINARDALEDHGAVRIVMSNRRLDERDVAGMPDMSAGEYVELKVEDDGPGIPAELLQKVFDPFFTTKPVGKGTGLGLSTVYGFARQSGGRATIQSTQGAGTSVSLLMPKAKDAAEPLHLRDSAAVTQGDETVLLVEDDNEVRDATAALLGDLGYTVLPARDPAEALEIAKSGAAFDLLISDVVMPGEMSSRKMAEILRADRPDLPILFISGYSRDAIVRDGRVDAEVNFLSKPFTEDLLALRVREVIDARAEATPTDAQGQRRRRILLCEDDVLIRMDVAEILRELGLDVVETATGRETLDLLQAEAFDGLLIDVGLPDMSGETVALEAREADADMAIIFVTGHTEVAAAKTLGKCATVQKPFDDRVLTGVLAKFGLMPKKDGRTAAE